MNNIVVISEDCPTIIKPKILDKLFQGMVPDIIDSATKMLFRDGTLIDILKANPSELTGKKPNRIYLDESLSLGQYNTIKFEIELMACNNNCQVQYI